MSQVLRDLQQAWYWDNWHNHPRYDWAQAMDHASPAGGVRLRIEPEADPEVYVELGRKELPEDTRARHLRTLESLHEQYGQEIDVREEVLQFAHLSEVGLYGRIGTHFVEAGYAVYVSATRFSVYRLNADQRLAFSRVAAPVEPNGCRAVLAALAADPDVVLPAKHRKATNQVLREVEGVCV